MLSSTRKSLSATGTAPDPRFSFANERTFLAWIRTGLALMIAGGAVAQFADVAGELRGFLAAVLIGLGAAVSFLSYDRWRRAEMAMRLEQPPPQPAALAWIACTLGIIGIAVGCGQLVVSFLK